MSATVVLLHSLRAASLALTWLSLAATPARADAVQCEGVDSLTPIAEATLAEAGGGVAEVSTLELRQLLAQNGVVLLDTRPRKEWAFGHIPGALHVGAKPGLPASLHTSDVAEIEALVGKDRSRALVLYCNGPFCGKSRRAADELVRAGFTNVRRYQLGAPVWRALGGVMVLEPEGAREIFRRDGTAVWIDVREPGDYARGSLDGARNLPRSRVLEGKDVGEVKAAKDDGRLPMEDHNTRIVVFGAHTEDARAVAEAIAREAFHNVAYLESGAETLQTMIAGR